MFKHTATEKQAAGALQALQGKWPMAEEPHKSKYSDS